MPSINGVSKGGAGSTSHRGKYNDPGRPEWKHLIPHTIYFYYFKKQANGKYTNDYYCVHYPNDPINPGELNNEIKKLVENAVRPNPNPRPDPGRFGSHPWRYISWLVVAVDSVELDPGAIEIAHTTPNPPEDNHNFFDGGVGVVTLPGGTKVGYMWTWNHMRDANGNELNGSQTFNFQLDRKPRKLVPELDESGTNTGPPVAPPPTGGVVPGQGHGHGHGKKGTGGP